MRRRQQNLGLIDCGLRRVEAVGERKVEHAGQLNGALPPVLQFISKVSHLPNQPVPIVRQQRLVLDTGPSVLVWDAHCADTVKRS